MATVTLDKINKVYDNGFHAIHDLDLSIDDKEFLVLVGPSGCGKSTALRMVAGLESITGGEMHIGDKLVNDVEPKDRDIAMVFQNYALYPHMSVYDNIGFALKLAKVSKDEIDQRVRKASSVLELDQYLDRKPGQLSGGQRQRVAMGRAIVRQPAAFLMDEPLSNLDAKLRVQTRTQIAALQRRLGVTTVYVTHDQVEAMTMGDRVAVLKDGILQQCASPRELFTQPVNQFVAGFIGSPAMNLLPATAGDNGASHGSLAVPLTPDQRSSLSTGEITIGVRPGDFEVNTEGGLDAVIDVVEELGSEAFLYCTADGTDKHIVARVEGLSPAQRGDHVSLVPKPSALHLFDASTGARLPG